MFRTKTQVAVTDVISSACVLLRTRVADFLSTAYAYPPVSLCLHYYYVGLV
jgi:hypothetical protein